MSGSAVLITAADAAFFDLARGTIRSVRGAMPAGRKLALGFLDAGCTPAQLDWVARHVDLVRTPAHHYPVTAAGHGPAFLKVLLARPFLRSYFPGFDVYAWVDADAWVQEWAGVDLLLRAAGRGRLAIVPELDRGHRVQYGDLSRYREFVRSQYRQTFGDEVARALDTYPVLNAGVFALHRRAPHWEPWAACLYSALRRSAGLMTDQTALNLVAYRHCFDRTDFLPAWCNWTCHLGLPAWDPAAGRLVEPYPPHTPIGVVHLTGRPKPTAADLRTTDGDPVRVGLRYPAGPDLDLAAAAGPPADRDYVSPGLVRIDPAGCFPDRTLADKAACPWPYLRREVPHRWWVDRRSPGGAGLLDPDEVLILYSTALQFAGRRGLDIGGWAGWSACHLALAGVQLDVVDPRLADPCVREALTGSLTAAGVAASVSLVPGASPDAVRDLAARTGRRWSLFLIAGGHESPASPADAAFCAEHAEPDVAVVFHNLAAPGVAEGLTYLGNLGWRTVVYQTLQIMGVAYRGDVVPVTHIPDPAVDWSLPEHLRGFAVGRAGAGPASPPDGAAGPSDRWAR